MVLGQAEECIVYAGRFQTSDSKDNGGSIATVDDAVWTDLRICKTIDTIQLSDTQGRGFEDSDGYVWGLLS